MTKMRKDWELGRSQNKNECVVIRREGVVPNLRIGNLLVINPESLEDEDPVKKPDLKDAIATMVIQQLAEKGLDLNQLMETRRYVTLSPFPSSYTPLDIYGRAIQMIDSDQILRVEKAELRKARLALSAASVYFIQGRDQRAVARQQNACGLTN